MFLIILLLFLLILLYLLTRHNLEPYVNHDYTPNELFTHLSFISDLLNKHNIKHWLMYGSLLGAVRNNDIIPYDYDFDLGANVYDYNKIMALNKLINNYGYTFVSPVSDGYNFVTGKNKQIWRVSIKIQYKGKTMGDIYLYKRCKDNMMRRMDNNNTIYFWPKGTYPAWFTDRLTSVNIRNKYFNAPRDPKILLKHWYGETWKTPIISKAQGGTGDKNSDYYGGAKDVKLSFLTDYLENKYKQTSRSDCMHEKLDIKKLYVHPKNQIQWIKDNEIFTI